MTHSQPASERDGALRFASGRTVAWSYVYGYVFAAKEASLHSSCF